MIRLEHFINRDGAGEVGIYSPTHVFGLEGDKGGGKTSLLFQYGYYHAKQDKHVVLLTRKRKLMKYPPYLPNDILADQLTLEKMTVVYIQHIEECISFLCTIHMRPQLPHILLIDDIMDLYPSSKSPILLQFTLSHIYAALHVLKQQDPNAHAILTWNENHHDRFPSIPACISIKDASLRCASLTIPLDLSLSVHPNGIVVSTCK